jgi:hypothetical protein
MSPASGAPGTDKLFPNRVEEDQDIVEMSPVVMGTPPFSSPDPATDGVRMVPLHNQTTDKTAAEAADEAAAASDEDKKAADWKNEIENAATEEELQAISDRYDESGADYKTVDEAFDKRAAEITALAEGSDNN